MSTMVATPNTIAGLIASNRSNAQSPEAFRLFELQERMREHLLCSVSVRDSRERLLTELDDICAEASFSGWDGYGAKPVNLNAYDFARTFIKALPTEAALPEPNVDADGEVSLSWFYGHRRALTVSVGPDGRCTFAWLLGHRSFRGTDWIEDEIPASIVFALRQLDQG